MGKQLCPSSVSFGRDVKQVRLARKLTQKRLDQTTGYSEAYVSRVEAGKLLPRPSEKFTKGRDIAFDTGELFAGMLRRIDEAITRRGSSRTSIWSGRRRGCWTTRPTP
nr:MULTISPECIES: helix-turn-helix domain-containing protein [unclassified Streptomyces]